MGTSLDFLDHSNGVPEMWRVTDPGVDRSMGSRLGRQTLNCGGAGGQINFSGLVHQAKGEGPSGDGRRLTCPLQPDDKWLVDEPYHFVSLCGIPPAMREGIAFANV